MQMFGSGSMNDHIYDERAFTYQVPFQVRKNFLYWRVLWFVMVGWLLLLGRIGYLQLWKHGDMLLAVNEQRVRLLSIPAPRGIIYDRNGKALVQNVPIFQYIQINPQGIAMNVVSREQALTLQAQGQSERLIETADRSYLMAQPFSHLLGYIGQASDDEISRGYVTFPCESQLRLGSLTGKSGIESGYDCELRGVDGSILMEVNTGGGVVRELGRQLPTSGSRIDLTLDAGLQEYAFELLEGKNGAIVATDVDGNILAMVSAPGFDPNIFALNRRYADKDATNQLIRDLFADTRKPLVNRAVNGAYPLGSVFKLVTATAALQEHVIRATDQYVDTGVVNLGSYEFRNWYFRRHGTGEGSMTIARALARSTDTFFYVLGGDVGVDKLAYWARQFGLGSRSALHIPEEVSGLVPDPVWKQSVRGERWYLGNTYHMAIGQGDLLVTPLQATLMVGAVVNGGKKCQPQLMKHGATCEQLPIEPQVLQTVLQGMVGACSPGGTAAPMYMTDRQYACKTGTAEYGVADDRGIKATHAWISVAGPIIKDVDTYSIDLRDDKALVVTVFVEGGGEGSEVAAPIARKLVDYWEKDK